MEQYSIVNLSLFCWPEALDYWWGIRGLNMLWLPRIPWTGFHFFPYSCPSMAFGAIHLFDVCIRRGFIPSLYGTFAILVLIGTVNICHLLHERVSMLFFQLGREIEEAAMILGASCGKEW